MKIAVIHTSPVTVTSLKPLFQTHLPDYQVCNFLDDSILPEINAAGVITHAVRARFYQLVSCAAATKPALILGACSSVGALLEECRDFTDIPLYRIDEPMTTQAVAMAEEITVAATLKSTLEPTCNLLLRKAEEIGKKVTLHRLLIEGAGALLTAGKTEEYQELIVSSLKKEATQVIVLAQASMAGAAAQITTVPVLSSPEAGILYIKGVLNGCE